MRINDVQKMLVLVVAVALLAFSCGSDDEESSSASPPVSLSGTVNDHGTETAGDELAMELDDNYFGPTYVQAKSNQSVKLDLENEGANIHTFTSETLGVDEEVAPGEKKTVTITAPGQGSALFFCRFHQAGGMQGAVFVR